MCNHKTRILYQLEDKVEGYRQDNNMKTIKDKSKRSNIQLERILERKEKR